MGASALDGWKVTNEMITNDFPMINYVFLLVLTCDLLLFLPFCVDCMWDLYRKFMQSWVGIESDARVCSFSSVVLPVTL
jgi:hypothetical protein